ncbi:MAG: hypothetical protein ABIJ18_00970 [archaeon]
MNKTLQLKERMYAFIQRIGPTIPIKVAKNFGSNTIFASAILSEFISSNKMKLTKAKIGGTPVYYIPGQESKLYPILRDHLGQLPRRAADLLEQEKILRDVDCEPAIRVALREVKDFAIQLTVSVEGNEEIFWKWHLLDDSITKEKINAILEVVYAPKQEPKVEEIVEEVKEEFKNEQEKIDEEIKEVFLQPEEVEEKEELVEDDEDEDEIDDEGEEDEQTSLLSEPREKETLLKADKPIEKARDFEKIVISFLNRKNINILEKQTIAKNREFNFIVKIPSNIGDLMYFVKAKSKKKINEGELLLAFTEGQNLKLPTLYVTNAEVSKKALDYMKKNMKGLYYQKINF